MNFMKEIKQRKERRFLKTLGRVGEILVEQVLIKLGSSIIKKIGGKKTLPSILFLFLSLSLFAQFPNTGNKQRLGFQTTGDGLVWRGSISDTASIQPINNQSAWVILDTINLKFYTFDFTSNVWNLVGGGGSAFTQPVDSLFFNVNVPTNNVDTAKMRWDSDLATVVLGLNDNVPNELGFKNFWLVKNQTGSTIAKGSLVYANGAVGASGRITVAKFIANGSIDAKYLLGITAHDLTDGEDGYVISFGKIRQVNTDTFAAGAILYPSPTVAGVWTDVEPVAPNIDMPIGFCINSHANNGTIAIRVASGYKLSELHDVAISSPIENSSLYYKGGLWRDTTAALLTSDTASMLTNYLRTGTAAGTYLTGSGTTNYIPKFTGTRILGNSLVYDSGTKIGIGNIDPNYLLDLKTNDNAKIFLRGGIAQNGILFDTISSVNSFYLFNGTLTTSGFGIYDVTNNINRLWVKNDGNIGVGTTSPNAKLDVNGTILTSRLNIAGGNQNSILLNNASNGITSGFLIGRSFATNNLQDLFIYDIENAAFRLNINSSGNIGIGTTNPAAKLEVHGSAVFNEGSADADFRVESDGNANMVFVDASTDRVGIGYASPTNTLDVNGTLGVFGATNLSNTLTVDGKTILNDSARFEGNILFKKNMGLPIVKISNADYTATTDNHTIIYTTLTSDKTLTIPNASDAVGVKFVISIFDIPEGNEALTLVTPSSNLFVRTDGENSNVDIVGGYCTTIQSDGTKWYILSYAPMY
jgi:hypothetical protein